MTARQHEANADATRASAQRLAELLDALTVDRPLVIDALERVVRALVVDERRQAIAEQLHDLDPEDLAAVEALVQTLVKNRRDARL